MRHSLLIIGLTLTATTWGCATTGTTTASTSSGTVGLQSLDGDVVLSGTTPEVPEGRIALEARSEASSGLWMETAGPSPAPEAWEQPTPRLDRMYRLVTPPGPNDAAPKVAYRRDVRRTHQ
jgi:hypothetical protein